MRNKQKNETKREKYLLQCNTNVEGKHQSHKDIEKIGNNNKQKQETQN